MDTLRDTSPPTLTVVPLELWDGIHRAPKGPRAPRVPPVVSPCRRHVRGPVGTGKARDSGREGEGGS